MRTRPLPARLFRENRRIKATPQARGLEPPSAPLRGSGELPLWGRGHGIAALVVSAVVYVNPMLCVSLSTPMPPLLPVEAMVCLALVRSLVVAILPERLAN